MPKLTISLLFVIFIAVMGIGGLLDNLFNHYQAQQNNDSDELTVYRQIGSSLALTLNKQKNPQHFIAQWQQQSELSVSLINNSDFFLPDSLQQPFYAGEPIVFETDENISIHFIVPSHNNVLIFTIPPTVNESSQGMLQLVLTSVFYLSILMVVLIWLYPLIKQLRQLRQSTKAFGEGELQQRVSTKSTSYIHDIETEFNRMAKRIETLISDNKLLTDAVSHDLRTPLARLRFGIEFLQETQDPQKREKYENRLSRDIDEMERLVNVLLNYARIEQTMIAVEQQTVDLNILVSQCVASASDSEKNLQWQPEGSAMINGDVNYLSMLINNLLGNSLQYANSSIKLNIEQYDSTLQFIISDDGPGIPLEKRDELLKPFIRGEQAHTSPGYGMGLAIVSRIVQLHDATLTITDSAELTGAEFRVTFKKSS